MKKIIISGSVVVCALVVYVLFLTPQSEVGKVIELGEPTITIVRTDSGYEPREVVIKKGEIILWKNESNEFHWPASDLHPTHGIYPEFDPLRPIAPGEDWKFKYDKVGEWKFHDHIRANKTGKITVTE